MKKNFTNVLVALAMIIMFFPACKKNNIGKTNANNVDLKKLSGQIGTTFYKSITGSYGSVDVSKGIKSPFAASASGHKGLVLNDIPSLCGFVVDTTYNYTVLPPADHVPSATDTTRKYYGHFHFVYTCDAGLVNGYNVADSVAYEESGFNFLNRSALAQNYWVKALDNTYKVVSMDGSVSTYDGRFKPYSEIGSSMEGIYYLTGLKVDFSSGTADIISGKAAFTIRVTPVISAVQQPPAYTDYYGILEYLGNHKAKLTINGSSAYLVDLITGESTVY
ncbi:MAG TPA: hypothetical protein VHA56_15955 [Mucilaginibacter sp.]|nr:hypothetical protein [Mucilaginibacter sp.]